jgi:hypothetical protein
MKVAESSGGGTDPVGVAKGPCGPTRARGPVRRRRSTVRVVSAVAVALAVVLIVGLIVPSLGRPAVPVPSADRSDASSDLLCNGVNWQTTHLAVYLSGCQAVFEVQYAENFSQPENSTNQYNFSFAIPWVAEITPQGALVRVAEGLAPVSAMANLTVLPGVVLSSFETLNVTNASGNWNPNDTGFGTGAPWDLSNSTVGNTTVGLNFYLFNASADSGANMTENTSLSVEFDFTVGSWPWVSSTDLLGFGLDSLGAWGSHFVFNPSSRTLQEEWNSTNRTFASLVFGTAANVSYPSDQIVPATVTEQAGVFDAGTPARESVVLATFGAVTGGYSFLVYDPWVVFSPGGTTIPPNLGPPGPSGGIAAWVPVALALAAVTTGLALMGTYVIRASVLRREGAELIEGMREALSRVPPSDRPK